MVARHLVEGPRARKVEALGDAHVRDRHRSAPTQPGVSDRNVLVSRVTKFAGCDDGAHGGHRGQPSAFGRTDRGRVPRFLTKENAMRTISREELKQKLDRKEDFRLVMALGEWAFQAKRIPGSIHFPTMREALASLNKEDEIVVYCSDETCIASRALGQLLERNGYPHVLHYAGGLQEWEQAGYPLEGEWVKEKER